MGDRKNDEYYSVNRGDGDPGRTLSRDARMSRNSTGAKEEFIAPRENDEIVVDLQAKAASGNELVIYFCCMVGIGLGNKIFSKLETVINFDRNPFSRF